MKQGNCVSPNILRINEKGFFKDFKEEPIEQMPEKNLDVVFGLCLPTTYLN